VPSEDEMEAQQKQAEQSAQAQGMPGATQQPPPPPGGPPGGGPPSSMATRRAAGPPPAGAGGAGGGQAPQRSSQDMGPRTNLVGRRTAGP
jgi:hypothetical protein